MRTVSSPHGSLFLGSGGSGSPRSSLHDNGSGEQSGGGGTFLHPLVRGCDAASAVDAAYSPSPSPARCRRGRLQIARIWHTCSSCSIETDDSITRGSWKTPAGKLVNPIRMHRHHRRLACGRMDVWIFVEGGRVDVLLYVTSNFTVHIVSSNLMIMTLVLCKN